MCCFAVTVDCYGDTKAVIKHGGSEAARTTAEQTSEHVIYRQENVMEKIQGRCLCGAIRYRSASEPIRTVACDCSHCQKQDGPAIAMWVGVLGKTLRVQGLIPSVYEDSRASGSVVLRSFCSECGSSLFSESYADPTMIFVKAATLDDNSWIQPQVTHSAARHRQGNRSMLQRRPSAEILEWPACDMEWRVSS